MRYLKSPCFWLSALVPAPSLGVLFGMILFPDTTLGKAVFAATKIWMTALPFVWWRLNRGCEKPWGKCGKSGIAASLAAGVAIFAVIVGAYALLGDIFIDKEFFAGKMREAGLGDKRVFFGALIYWIFVNSLLEEIVWRWFVTNRFTELAKPAAAVALSGLCFTLHHILAMSVFFPARTNLVASAGVFAGGVLFSWLFIRCKSVWPPYIAHVFADVAVFGIGFRMLAG